MQLIGSAVLALLLVVAQAQAQSLTPMRATGVTPTDTKAFRLKVGNPYPTAKAFIVMPMEPGFAEPATQVLVRPNRLTIPPGGTRVVLVAIQLPDQAKEREIGVCVMPDEVEGDILPRVCGTYVARGARRTGE